MLDRLLLLRRLERDRRAALLRAARDARRSQEGELRERDAARRETDAGLVARSARGVDAAWWRSASRALGDLLADARRAEQELEQARGAEHTAQEASRDAERRVEGLEELADEHAKRARSRQRVLEQKQLDDHRPARAVRGRGLRGLGVALLVFGALQALPAHAQGPDSRSVERLLSELRTRMAQLDRWESSLEERERALELLDRTVAERIEELGAIADRIDQRITEWEEAQGAKAISRLAKIYGAMPPPQAAQLVEGLEIDLATRILGKMKPRQSGALLPLLSEERARNISRLVSHPLGVPPAAPAEEAQP